MPQNAMFASIADRRLIQTFYGENQMFYILFNLFWVNTR